MKKSIAYIIMAEFQDNTDTDWFSEVFKTGTRQNHNINLSGVGQIFVPSHLYGGKVDQ